MSDLAKQVRSQGVLHSAWRHVKDSARSSSSKRVKEEVVSISEDSNWKRRIQNQLKDGRFDFKRQTPYLKGPKGKKRPIVVAAIEVRIVQRAILDVLMEQPSVKKFLVVDGSYGGLPKRSVRTAMEDVVETIGGGYSFYIRADIVEFFRHVKRLEAIDRLLEGIEDDHFKKLVVDATKAEISNLDSMKELFPTFELGLSQGFCLSPLLANAYLFDFDIAMNGRDVRTFRYIDDFLMLSTSEAHLDRAFESAKRRLEDLSLRVHEPGSSSKAERGSFTGGLDFLGCRLQPGQIMPSKASRVRLLEKIDTVIDRFTQNRRKFDALRDSKASLLEVLTEADHIVAGWGNQYAFCNCVQLWEQLDQKVDEKLGRVLGEYKQARKAAPSDVVRRRLLGVHALVDSKSAPIFNGSNEEKRS